jgi:hypothetical protein
MKDMHVKNVGCVFVFFTAKIVWLNFKLFVDMLVFDFKIESRYRIDIKMK